MISTNKTYPWSFVTQLFCNRLPGQCGHRKSFEVMISSYTAMNSLFSNVIVSKWPFIKEIMTGTSSSGISNQLRYLCSICTCCWNVAKLGKVWTNLSHIFCRKVSFSLPAFTVNFEMYVRAYGRHTGDNSLLERQIISYDKITSIKCIRAI